MKRKRKQPRRLTPPLVLRDDSGGRHIIEVDDQIITTSTCSAGRSSIFLSLGPGLRIRVGSRSQNKRRITSLAITTTAGSGIPSGVVPGGRLRELRDMMSG